MLAQIRGNNQLLGVLCITGAMLTISIQDTIVKWISGGYPLHELMLGRSIVAILLTLLLLKLEGGFGQLRTPYWHLHLFRGLLIFTANMCYFLALAAVPIAEALAIFYVAPLFITLFSIPFLGERVGPYRWMAVASGLLGAVIVLRPGGSSEPAAFLPLISAVSYAAAQIFARRLGLRDKASVMAFYLQVTFILSCLASGLLFGSGTWSDGGHPSLAFLMRAWFWPAAEDLVFILAIGVLNGFGGYILTQAYRISEAAVVAPFEYLVIPLAILWGYLLWRDLPDAVALLGIALIIGGGLFVLYRERKLGKRAQALPLRPQR
jgi:drug/metabolite transporter (DMT)-like permease